MGIEKSVPYRDGWCAHKNGEHASSNPYSETTQEFSNAQWLTGWCGRFNAIKHVSSVSDLDDVHSD